MVYSHMIIIDFEANQDGEIIEFPAVLIDLETGDIEDEFHSYVCPYNTDTSTYNYQLTGIRRSDIFSADTLDYVLCDFDEWLQDICNLYCIRMPKAPRRFLSNYRGRVNCAFVTWGNDLGTYLYNECENKDLDMEDYLKRWINLQYIFKRYFRLRSLPSLDRALHHVNMEFYGRRHCGLHDARNTAKLCCEMFQNGVGMDISHVIRE